MDVIVPSEANQIIVADNDGELDVVISNPRDDDFIRGPRIQERIGDSAGNSNKVWLISFTDIMGLMLTFFVMTYAMAEPKSHDMKNLSAMMENDRGSFKGSALNAGESDTITMPRLRYDPGLDAAYLSQILDRKREDTPSLQKIKTEVKGRNIEITLPLLDILPDGGRVVPAQNRPALAELASILQSIPNQIELLVSRPEKNRDLIRDLQAGQIIAAALRKEGVRQSFPVLVNTNNQVNSPALTIRVTRFSADQ